MTMDDEEFYAWLDGELTPEQARAVEARVAASPELTRLAAQHRALKTDLRAAFDGVATDAPSTIATADLVAFPKSERHAANENRRIAPWASVAAALAIGLVAGTLLPNSGGGNDPVRIEGGQMVAAAALDQALDKQLASAGDGGAVRIGLTFRNADGKWCRSFDGAAGAGLACRAGDDWQVRALYPAQASGGDYRMAAGVDPRLAAMIDEAMAGEAADGVAERAARDGGWR